MKIQISNQLEIDEIPEPLEREIKTRLTVKNPAYVDALKMGRWTNQIDEHLFCYQTTANGLTVPRGFIRQLADMAKQHRETFHWTDRTRELDPVDFVFTGTLRPYQAAAVSAVIKKRFGVLQAPTGSGKTVMALSIIAGRGQSVLVVCHARELQAQWVDRISQFLDIPKDEIGIIGGGKKRIGDRVTVAMVQSLHKCKEDVYPHIGHLIVDECHRAPSRTFTEAVTAFDSRYMLGLSATPYRRDGLTKLIYWHIGDRAHSIDQKDLTASGAILPFRVKTLETRFTTHRDPSAEYSRMISDLTKDPERNALICSEAEQQVINGHGVPLIISDRKAHCQVISEILDRDHGIVPIILTGDLSKKARKAVVKKLNDGKCKALVATGQLVGEGFDLPALGSVLLATPLKFKGRVIQYVGRALRPSPGQDHATVVDFVDKDVGVLEHSAKKRMQVYREMGASGC